MFLRCGVCWMLLFFILDNFLPFSLLTAQKIKISKKKKNEKNKCRYHHLSQVHQKSWSYAILFLRYGAWQMQLLFFILGYFLPFYPPNSTKNEYFKKMKKIPGDIIIPHNCTKNHDHMLCCSWDMACGKCKYCF